MHQVRKRCKKIRATLRLVRGDLGRDDTFRKENAWFRDAARTLSYIRDAEALIETLDKLTHQPQEELNPEAFEVVHDELTARRQQLADGQAKLNERLSWIKDQMQTARNRISSWPLTARGFHVLRTGIEKTYRRARAAFADAYHKSTDEAFHEWRKRVKYHWYHCRLLHDLWPPVMAARRGEADRLGDMLGDAHDLAVFQRTLLDQTESFEAPGTLDAVLKLAALRREELQRQARALGARLLAEKPEHLSRRFHVVWTAWRGESGLR